MLVIMEALDEIPDPRDQEKVTYPLASLLFMAICAIFCGAESWDDMSTWSDCHLEWLSKYIDISEGAPSYSTFRRIFMMLKPEHFSAITQFIIRYHSPSPKAEDHIPIDGKSLRGTRCMCSDT